MNNLPFDPYTVDTNDIPVDFNFPLNVIITNNENVFPLTRMPKRSQNSAFSDELNNLIDLVFSTYIWSDFCEVAFPMWDRVNQPHHYCDDTGEIDKEWLDQRNYPVEQIPLFKAFQNGLSFDDFLECANERDDGYQYWYGINPKTNQKDVFHLNKIVINTTV